MNAWMSETEWPSYPGLDSSPGVHLRHSSRLFHGHRGEHSAMGPLTTGVWTAGSVNARLIPVYGTGDVEGHMFDAGKAVGEGFVSPVDPSWTTRPAMARSRYQVRSCATNHQEGPCVICEW